MTGVIFQGIAVVGSTLFVIELAYSAARGYFKAAAIDLFNIALLLSVYYLNGGG